MKKLFCSAILSLLFASSVFAQTAPQPKCGDLNPVVVELKEKYGETLEKIFRLTGSPRSILLFSNQETQTWTMFVLEGPTLVCLLASGTGFKTLEQSTVPLGEPA